MAVFGNYCDPRTSLAQAWVQGGFSPCFYATLVPTVLLTFSLFFGTFHWVCYQHYGTEMEPKYVPRSRLYRLQQGLSVLLLLQFLVGMIWRAEQGTELHGHVLVYGCLSALGWACAIALLYLEHRRVLVRDRTRGHSALLLLFWALAFSAENLAFVSWYSPLWWWGLESTDQQVSFEALGEHYLKIALSDVGYSVFRNIFYFCSLILLGF